MSNTAAAWPAESVYDMISAAPDFLRLARHVMAMADDAHFVEQPEWAEIVKDAEAALTAAGEM